jgi:DNA modification methylase
MRRWVVDRDDAVVDGDGWMAVQASDFDFVPDGSVDLVLTDPPFNIARKTNFHTYKNNRVHSFQHDAGKGWDTHTSEDFIDVMGAWAREFRRVLRPGGSFAVFCADAYLSHLWDAMVAQGLEPKRAFTWRKPNAVPVNRSRLPMSACEYVVWGRKKGPHTFNADLLPGSSDDPGEELIERSIVADKAASIVYREVQRRLAGGLDEHAHRPDAVAKAVEEAVRCAAESVGERITKMYVDDGSGFRACVPNHIENPTAVGRNRMHPTEKPVELLKFFVALCSRPGDTLLDPFAGSHSTGVAALELGRKVVLVEEDPDYFGAGSARLTRAASDR